MNVARQKQFTNSLIVILVSLLGGALSAPATAQSPTMSVQRIAAGVSRPVFGVCPPGDPNRMFIIEQHTGRIEILDLTTNTISPTAFLDLNGLSTGNEQGLLGLAFHPDYESNGYFYVNYTESSFTTRVKRYTRLTADLADASSSFDVLSISQPQPNHNGGWIGFGPDNFLYIASGDGGGADDNDFGHTAGIGNGQDITDNLLGKMLRVDINGDDFGGDATRNYAIPGSNPFVGIAGDDEIFAFGLRNPWRNSFDRRTKHLFIGDVGQNVREEIDVLLDGSGGGQNYGWRLREGMIQTPTGGVGGPKPPGAVDPIYNYLHGFGSTQGFAVIGGYVYRGPIEALQGHYFFTDNVNSRLWSFKFDCTTDQLDFAGNNYTNFIDWTNILTTDIGTPDQIASFAEDAAGNLYLMGGFEIFKITGATIPATRILAEGFNVDFGSVQSGGLAELQESDNQYLRLNPRFNQFRYQLSFTINGTSSTPTPCELKFVYEAKVLNSVGSLTQQIQLFNYETGQFETVDSRTATSSDSVVVVMPDGDLSRFVEAGTNAMQARINYQNHFLAWVLQFTDAISPFTTSVDQAFWRTD